VQKKRTKRVNTYEKSDEGVADVIQLLIEDIGKLTSFRNSFRLKSVKLAVKQQVQEKEEQVIDVFRTIKSHRLNNVLCSIDVPRLLKAFKHHSETLHNRIMYSRLYDLCYYTFSLYQSRVVDIVFVSFALIFVAHNNNMIPFKRSCTNTQCHTHMHTHTRTTQHTCNNRYDRLLDVLTKQRLAELSIPARAVIIHAIQKVKVRIPNGMDSILRIFEGTRSGNLTKLKRLLDTGTSYYDLHNLVFSDLTKEYRDRMLTHINTQAALSSNHCKVKILSDIDDTLQAKLWDRRWPKNTIYPGIRKLYEELDRGFEEKNDLGDLTFLTARPKGFRGVFENYTLSLLAQCGLHAQPCVLFGIMQKHYTLTLSARFVF